MKTPCKICVTVTCSCPNRENNGWEGSMMHMKSPVSRMCNGLPQDKRFQRRLKNLLSNSPCTTIRESPTERNENFTSTPSKSTPPVIRNPFDVEIDSLVSYSCSPSMFLITEKKPDEKQQFRWSIEQLSDLNCANIDEESYQHNGFHEDSETESKLQAAIDVFWKQGQIVPSPWAPSIESALFTPVMPESQNETDNTDDPAGESNEHGSHTVSTQTMLTIPPNLDLMSLLGHFYTYGVQPKRNSLDGSLSEENSTPSTSFRRCKLFTNDEDKDAASETPRRNREENNNVKFSAADFDAWSPHSDNFSSSPKTPKKFSLSGYGDGILLCSPNFSPICKESNARVSRVDMEISMDNTESSQKQGIQDQRSCTPQNDNSNAQSVMMTSASEFEFGISSNTCDPSKQSNLCPDERTFSNSSNQKDTGYFTGSIHSAASMLFQQTSSDVHYRTTPVAELLGDCAITGRPELCSNLSSVSCDMDECMVSMDQSKADTYGIPMNFSNMPWQPNMFSTPSKSRFKSKSDM